MFPLPHLRSGFRRRGQSNPTSPLPDQHQYTLWESSAFHEHPHAAQDVSPRPDSPPESSNAFRFPPTLPPITRVTSAEDHPDFGPREDDTFHDRRLASARSPRHDDDVGFIGGLALANQRRTLQEATGREHTTAHMAPNREPQQPRTRVPPPPINTGIPYQRPPPLPNIQTKAGSSFVTPTDLQQLSAEPKGKRPVGTRLVSEPAVLAHHLQALEVSKGRRGLSSLKDRFLMKRKAAPVTPEIGPVSPRLQYDPGFDYDPRIVGRRFHDFDNPNRRKPQPQQQQIGPGQPAASADPTNEPRASYPVPDARDRLMSTQQHEGDDSGQSYNELHHGERVSTASHSVAAGATDGHTVKHQHKRRPLSLDKALPKAPLPQQGDEGQLSSEHTPAVSRQGSSAAPRSNQGARKVQSRNVSISDPTRTDSIMSAIPKHMKSTSSRFSFDMVGAASQEKLLEEKHRQRQIEKGVDDGGFAAKDRDSRFDDFDNDDYDYDAMMDDDGLEERIPGVNADAEDDDYPEEEIPGVNADGQDGYYQEEGFEDELDPDNDQENFSGFVFQRSNPASAVTSPLPPDMLPTPRDPTGKVIGFAVTKDMTPELAPGPSPIYQSGFAARQALNDSSEGLGILGLDADHQPAYDKPPYEDDQAVQATDASASVPIRNDDLYYDDDFIDDALRDELNFEPEGPAFDESLFDLNDTDKYGRPIPGAFAHAKSLMTAQQQASNRQSDEASRMSGQSPMSMSTAHTSVETAPQLALPDIGSKDVAMQFPPQSERRSSVVPAPSSELAYQAALAEAAHKAAASGKFRRNSSPAPPDPHLSITSPTDSTESHSRSHLGNGLDIDDESRGLDDDYDFDDDVIAEANAEALANDSDGWYGREFGFYSTPLPVPSSGHGHHGSGSSSNSSPKPLSAENLFQYANGGYFGPDGGVIRSASGRMVSREPNLTPITERSEYSNRNSIMSFSNLPGGGSINSAGVGGGASQLQSPGLAELAMMDGDDANMSMSALLRLRSKTFGSSKASLLSSPDGSPRSEFSPGGLGGGVQRDGATSPWGAGSGFAAAHMRKNSAFSMQSTTSDGGGGSGAGSPTLTMGAPLVSAAGGGLAPSPFAAPQSGGVGQYPPACATSPVLPGFPPVLEEDLVEVLFFRESFPQGHGGDGALGLLPLEMPPPPHAGGVGPSMTAAAAAVVVDDNDGRLPPLSPTSLAHGLGQLSKHQRPGMGHRHKGSADSISYIKEEDSGETRWVMERRRTAETGEIEVLEREVVQGEI